MAQTEERARTFRAVVTWQDGEIDSDGTKEDAASAFKEWINDMDSEVIMLTKIENIEEL